MVRVTRELTRMFAVDMERAATVRGSLSRSASNSSKRLRVRALSDRYFFHECTEQREAFEEFVTFNARATGPLEEIRQKRFIQLAGGFQA